MPFRVQIDEGTVIRGTIDLLVTGADRADLHDRVLHAPTNPPLTQREVVTAIAVETGNAVPPLPLALNPDILSTIAHRATGRPPLVVGFAAETENVVEHARAKLARKGCDLIVANDVSPASGVMGGTQNTVHLVTPDAVETWPTLDKEEVATRLIERLATLGAHDAGRTG